MKLWNRLKGGVEAGAERADLEAAIASQLEHLPRHFLAGIGPGDFFATGVELAEILRRVGKLRRHDRVLEVGCGLGRVAIPLQRLLTRGSYDGLDALEDYIHWGQTLITEVSPHFRFHHIDVANTFYNPEGNQSPAQAVFPFATGYFTFAFATSLFSHLLADGARRYLEEIARVVRPGGRTVLTFLLLDAAARRRAAEGLTYPPLPHSWEHGLLGNVENPEEAVAYDQDWALTEIEKAGFRLVESVQRGRWHGREDGICFQDVLVLRRR